jgi:hypothetical protein
MIRQAVAVAAPVQPAATDPGLAGQNENVAPNAPLRAKCRQLPTDDHQQQFWPCDL